MLLKLTPLTSRALRRPARAGPPPPPPPPLLARAPPATASCESAQRAVTANWPPVDVFASLASSFIHAYFRSCCKRQYDSASIVGYLFIYVAHQQQVLAVQVLKRSRVELLLGICPPHVEVASRSIAASSRASRLRVGHLAGRVRMPMEIIDYARPRLDNCKRACARQCPTATATAADEHSHRACSLAICSRARRAGSVCSRVRSVRMRLVPVIAMSTTIAARMR